MLSSKIHVGRVFSHTTKGKKVWLIQTCNMVQPEATELKYFNIEDEIVKI